jgi:PAS domain S-box-containing protein
MPGGTGETGRDELLAVNEALQRRIERLEQVVVAQAEAQAEQRDRNAKRLRQTEQRYEELVRICPFGIMIHYANHIMFINERGAQILGGTGPAQVLGREPMEFLHPDSEAMFWQRNDQLHRDGEAPAAEFMLRRLDGSGVHVEAASVVFYIGGKRAVQTVFQDVTARRELAQRERDQERAGQFAQKLESLGLFAGGVAERLNTLLIGILGNTNLALGEVGEDPQLRSILSEVEYSALQARALSAQMLALAGRSVSLVAGVGLNRLVETELDRLAARLPRQIAVERSLSASLPPVDADAAQLGHALQQLVDNAVEALGRRGGTLRVSTGVTQLTRQGLRTALAGGELREGRYCYLEVADGAGGIEPERLLRLFDPFSAGREAGRGLGLPIVQGILRAHRGAVQLTSRPGVGTTARLLLPLGQPGAVLQSGAPHLQGGRLVLVIDDEPIVTMVAEGILRRAGYEVLSAANGSEGVALAAAHHGRLKAVLLDLTMPEMDGVETFARLQQQSPGLPVILTSGYTETDALARFGEARPVAMLQKPYDAAQLLAKLQAVLPARHNLRIVNG